MQQLEDAVVELGIELRFGDELPGRNGLYRFVGVEAHERSCFVGTVVIEADHSGIFIVELAAEGHVVRDVRRRSGRDAGGIGVEDGKKSRRSKGRLRQKRGARDEADLGSIKALPQTLIGGVKEELSTKDRTAGGCAELVQKKWIGRSAAERGAGFERIVPEIIE